MTQVAKKRKKTLELLVADYGCATECDIQDILDGDLGRWALVEADEGSADNGGPWWQTGDDWKELLDASANQEYPGDWIAERLFDLDSFDGGRNGWSTAVRAAYIPEDIIGPQTYEQAIKEANSLIEPDAQEDDPRNREYARGMVELITGLWYGSMDYKAQVAEAIGLDAELVA